METFKPFTIEIKINSIEDLSALWMLANSNKSTEDFFNENWQRKQYKLPYIHDNPFGKHWEVLQKEIVKYNHDI